MGALFILTWNASVIGTAIGNFIRTELYQLGTQFNLGLGVNYFQIISIGLLKYVIHGVPEIMAYFVAGLAGGIISTAAIRHDFGTKRYEKIIMDSSVLLLQNSYSRTFTLPGEISKTSPSSIKVWIILSVP